MHWLRRRGFQLVAISISAALAMSLAGCREDRWTGIVYPDGADLTKDFRLGEFDTLNACRAAARKKIASEGWTRTADYECGSNCRPLREGSDLLVCDETLR